MRFVLHSFLGLYLFCILNTSLAQAETSTPAQPASLNSGVYSDFTRLNCLELVTVEKFEDQMIAVTLKGSCTKDEFFLCYSGLCTAQNKDGGTAFLGMIDENSFFVSDSAHGTTLYRRLR